MNEIPFSSSRIHWHSAFLQAMQHELYDYLDSLEFKFEYQLTTEPLRIDLLIVKKPKRLVITKNIARMFRSHNLLEYKSPDDYLSVKDFYKVYGYAHHYAAITPGVDLSDVTITFIQNRHPRVLLRFLAEKLHCGAEEASPGIYAVSGDRIPM